MRIKTFDEILTGICDTFDSLILPKKMARANTNILYLIFKAVAKGFEVINNTVVALNNKFDPFNCSPEDLESVGKLVGTKKLKGAASGLRILAVNNSESISVLLAGTYIYPFNSDINFIFTLPSDVTIVPSASEAFIAFSDVLGRIEVTAQNEITVTSEMDIPEGLTFSCSDNINLLGYADETDLEFRTRVLTDTGRQDVIKELETALKNLPYVFDCKVLFNDSLQAIQYEGITIPSYHMLIVLAGDKRPEIAQLVCEKAIYPTVMVDENSYIDYESPVFATGKHKVYVTDFGTSEYSVRIYYKANATYVSISTVEAQMRTAILNTMNVNVHKDVITDKMIFDVLTTLNLDVVAYLGVELYVNGAVVPYVSVPKSKLPVITSVAFTLQE